MRQVYNGNSGIASTARERDLKTVVPGTAAVLSFSSRFTTGGDIVLKPFDFDSFYEEFRTFLLTLCIDWPDHSPHAVPPTLLGLTPPASGDALEIRHLFNTARMKLERMRERLNHGEFHLYEMEITARDILQRVWEYIDGLAWPFFRNPERVNLLTEAGSEDDPCTLQLNMLYVEGKRYKTEVENVLASSSRQSQPTESVIGLDEEDITILRHLDERRPELLPLVAVEAATAISKKTVGQRLKDTLIPKGLAVRPRGPKQGVTITEAGRNLLRQLGDRST